MTVENVITSVFGTDDYSQYEQTVYEEYQQKAEAKIITRLNTLLSTTCFLALLKQWGAGCACRFIEYRDITVRMKSGRSWNVRSPVFLRAKPKNKRGRAMKRQQGVLRHLGLEVLGIIKLTSITTVLIQSAYFNITFTF